MKEYWQTREEGDQERQCSMAPTLQGVCKRNSWAVRDVLCVSRGGDQIKR